MKLQKFALAVAASAALGFSSVAAADYSFSFGDLLTGSTGVPDTGGGASWATLAIANTTGNTYTFSLTLGSNFDDIFGAQSFLGAAFFNNSTAVTQGTPTLLAGSWGVTKVTKANGNGGTGIFEFGDNIGQGANNRLVAGESVSWSATFSSALNLVAPEVGLHVQGIGVNGGNSGWYTPTTAIPEPETYAMLLAGLGLMGFVARRRQRAASAA